MIDSFEEAADRAIALANDTADMPPGVTDAKSE